MTTNPIAVLDVDDARELLLALDCDRHDWSFTRDQRSEFYMLSKDGWRIIEQLQSAVREATAHD